MEHQTNSMLTDTANVKQSREPVGVSSRNVNACRLKLP
jgi:hypothetical protein